MGSFATRNVRGRTNYGAEVDTKEHGSSCEQLFDVINVSADSFGLDPEFASKPVGSFRFEVSACNSARITLRFPETRLPRNTIIRSYGPAIQDDSESLRWNTLPSTLSNDRPAIIFVVPDNQLGDARADGNRILFKGGPAMDLFENGFDD